ncbi:beta-lactamase family protein [Sphingomonas sp. QA11]|uniref:serine hydrolase domain-containing protein n=1 Tax=Sphingomonas sp. QA11 TaxID=2950605 RepID=UPI00234B9DDA|nr:serine hydrolase domain-containing protein [Sphingomonas sp. QA11]WCM26861.1 beta-lactamase family protein [Sphingomonas sp. QA11]
MYPIIRVTITTLPWLLVGLASPAFPQARIPATAQSAIDLDAAFRAIAPEGPGCAAGVSVAGVSSSIKGYGQADLEHRDPITAESIFETGSLAKQFTAAAMLLLVQDGRLALDDDIRRYLPEMPDYGTPITIRHLLNHTSGLREQWSLLALTGNPPGTQVHNQATILDLASRQKGLNFRPGAEFLYTNTNYALAAIIVERVSGKSLQQFTDQRLFRPLGMDRTRWREDFRTVVPGRATAYAPAGEGFIANMPFTNVYGNGGLLTTIGDLLRWNAFLDKPSALPGGQGLVAALQTPGSLSDGTTLDYALGLEINHAHGQRLVSHSGSTGGYKAWLGRYPDQRISVAILCNNGGIDPVAVGEKLAEQALRATGNSRDVAVATAPSPVSAVPAASSSPDLTPYRGLFRNPVTGELVQTEVAKGRLMLRQGATDALVALGGGRFRRTDGTVLSFVRSGPGPVELIAGTGSGTQRFVAVPPAQSGGAALAEFVGDYYSAELDTRIAVVRQGDTLVMRQRFGIEWPLSPSFADGFTTRLRGTTTLVFGRAADGRVNGFGAWANGARNISFVKQ